jgi:uncharacterized protein (DUF1330 family)
MAAYLIAEVEITDPSRYERYKALTSASIAVHGGRYLVRGGAAEPLEGAPPKRIVVMEFPDMDAARRWYNSPEYAEAKALRQEIATARLLLAEGMAPA